MAFNSNGLGISRYFSSILFTGLAIMFWAIVNIIDTIAPSPALDTVKVLAYIAIAFSGLTIVIDVLIYRYSKGKKK